jgi:hypothetical protein
MYNSLLDDQLPKLDLLSKKYSQKVATPIYTPKQAHPPIQLTQQPTQKTKSGITDLYKDKGTYVKSFYSVMVHPSSVFLRQMGYEALRIHHAISWNNTTPKILNSQYKK